MRRRLLVLLAAAALVAPACGGSSGPDAAATDAGQQPPGPAGEPGFEPVASDGYPRAADAPALLRDVWAEGHDGFDRVVVELDGAAEPSFRVAPIDGPVPLEDSEGPAPIEGAAFLQVRFAAASALTPDGARSFQGPDRVPVPDGGIVTEVVRTGGTGGPLTFAVGLREEAPFTVSTREDPARLVIDIEHGA